ncbi:hypothetical protein [Alteromonas oceanisediminis]|uniref:hypothetical protein n=1 Tax=Alteromonas oceanisediminis TaxID=2836180 RepID=UPI001BDB0767|nr:hypothetical protein [Alteromonas oceanisediminis]MBT0585279.1 hypothetical protein [Alteromonas oceanisediminis]
MMLHRPIRTSNLTPQAGIVSAILHHLQRNYRYDVSADAFGNWSGNSIVRQSINQPEPRFTGTIDTSKLDAKLAQQFGSDFDKATDNQISQIAEQTATNLTDTVVIPETNFADITTFANSNAGVNLALSSVAQSNQLNRRLGEQALSVRNAQALIGATQVQDTIRAPRETDPIAAADALARTSSTRSAPGPWSDGYVFPNTKYQRAKRLGYHKRCSW